MVSENHHWIHQIGKRYLKNSKLTNFVANKTAFVSPFLVISGVIDCVTGAESAIESYQRRDYKMCQAYVAYSVGGAMVALGATAMITGGEVAVVSAGTASVPAAIMISGGICMSFLGLVFQFFWDDEKMKDWLDNSIFGDNPKILDIKLFSKINSDSHSEVVGILLNLANGDFIKPAIKSEIKWLNDIMFEFFIEGSIKQEENGGTHNMYNDTSKTEHLPPKIQAKLQARKEERKLPRKYTMMSLKIEPKLMTNNAVITISNIKKKKRRGSFEFFGDTKYFSENMEDVVIKMEDFYLSADKKHKHLRGKNGGQIVRDEQGRIILINYLFVFKQEMIDAVTGTVTIDFKQKNGKQIITKLFNIKE